MTGKRFVDDSALRAYAFMAMRNAIACDANDADGWLLGGVEDEAEREALRSFVRREARRLRDRARKS